MAIGPGSRVGPYDIIALLGEGGMGRVWRARHRALKRDDALKVLPGTFAADPERVARLQREAEVLASLNHPNIARVYGLEEADGKALVMELVEGPTLDRVAEGPIPLDEALPIAKQIAEAMEAAHEQGIVHRDLKPANIKVTPAGVVKVLDFGLAKTSQLAVASPSASDAATITTPAMTHAGLILGTAAYMSPEQAKGRAADKRSDIWAFGCVLYEMLAGRRAFSGDGVADTIAAVVRSEPDWRALPATVPSSFRRLLVRCLDKDPRRRLRDIGEARVELENTMAGARDAVDTIASQPTIRRRALLAGLALGLFLSLLVGFGVWRAARPGEPQVSRLSIVPPVDAPLRGSSFAITPDGTRFVYVSGDGSQLSVRAIDELTPRHITNLGVPSQPFISPDGQWIGFFDGMNALKKVPMTGGPAVIVAGLGGAAPRGASWTPDGAIVFATDDPATGLWRVAETGGSPTLLTKPEQGDHQWPYVLPGGRAVLFTQIAFASSGGGVAGDVAVLDLAAGTQKVLLPGSHAQFASGGHLVYGVSGTLRAVRFDTKRLEVVGTSVAVLDSVATPLNGPIGISLAPSGTFGYLSGVSGGLDSRSRRLMWVDRQGNEESLGAPPEAFAIPRLSPDGTKVVIDDRADVGDGLAMWDIERKRMTRFSFGVDAYPVWSPDGTRVAFTSFDAKTGTGHLFWQAVTGAGGPERLEQSSRSRYATSFTPDGSRLVFREEAGEAGLDIGVLTLESARRSELLIQTRFSELNPEISPDGKWLAYESNRSGRAEIYVCPFPDVNAGLWQVSTSGGVQPVWARNGRELFYRAQGGSLMAATVELKPSFSAAAPTKIVDARYFTSGPFRSYDPSPDGKRFLMITQGDVPAGTSSPATIVVVQNWVDELRRLVPSD
jgi:serine/threonine-protein kinase